MAAKTTKKTLPVVGQDEAPIVYCDSVESGIGLYDIKLHFRQTVRTPDGKKDQIRHLFTVCLSPPHMKLFATMMQSQLATYEESFGSIPTPETSGSSGEDES